MANIGNLTVKVRTIVETKSDVIRNIAEVCHEANRAYCMSIGDNSQAAWEHAPEWQIKSALDGVEFHLRNPDAKPSDSHDSWMEVKEKAGWKYGPLKDPEKKEHPCFVPYDDLPSEQRAKDYIFGAIAKRMIIQAGLAAWN